MKKFLIGLLTIVMCFTLVGCSSSDETGGNTPDEETQITDYGDGYEEEYEYGSEEDYDIDSEYEYDPYYD